MFISICSLNLKSDSPFMFQRLFMELHVEKKMYICFVFALCANLSLFYFFSFPSHSFSPIPLSPHSFCLHRANNVFASANRLIHQTNLILQTFQNVRPASDFFLIIILLK